MQRDATRGWNGPRASARNPGFVDRATMAAAGTVAVALAAAGACCLYAEVLALRAERAESRARQAPTDGGDKQQTRRGRRRHRPPADDGRVSPSQPARKCRNDGKRRVSRGQPLTALPSK